IRTSKLGFRPTTPRQARLRSSGIGDPFSTRIDQIRGELPPGLTSTGPLGDPAMRSIRHVATPVRRALYQRNLLRPRSELSRLSQTSLPPDAHSEESLDLDNGVFSAPEDRHESSENQALAVSSYQDHLKELLRRTEVERFAKGVEYFRQGKLVQAAHFFDVCKTLDRTNARYYVADLMVEYERENGHRVVINLIKALETAETLEDLRIPVEDDPSTGAKGFYLRDDRGSLFANTVDKANVRANLATGDGAGYPHLILALFAWLNGEVSTAIHATEVAESGLTVEHAAIATKFRELMINERMTALPGSSEVK
ncbi:MAG: hypothetical protein O7H40_15450, partial [Gammaproteobacteria bacterium]|nr:hypothetical protein [Gammaproteobacteria bacterium]